MYIQEAVAFIIVAVTALWMGQTLFRNNLAAPLSEWALKRGRVKWAMRLRRWSRRRTGCDHCH